MLKPYEIECPDPECAAAFTFEGDPEVLKTEEGETITCPECGGEWDWTFYAETDTLELLAADDEDDEEFDDEDDEEEDDE